MIKCFHEAPLSAFKAVQAITDGDYALVHLFRTDKVYLAQFEQAVAMGREVILDNSLFELRTKFDPAEFANWVCYLKPTYYIVPDVWKDCDGTIDSFFDFYERRVPHIRQKAPDSKIIGVAQGLRLADTAKCYKAIEPYCDKIAFNFDYSMYWTGFKYDTPAEAMSYGRMAIIRALDELGVINREKPHHLLGCGVPQEMKFYRQMNMDFIDSVDTCNPVINGMRRRRYSPDGLHDKLPDKMCDCMLETIDTDQWLAIEHNIQMFRSFAND